MDDKVLTAALAGLLHDVGRFAQLAAAGIDELESQDAAIGPVVDLATQLASGQPPTDRLQMPQPMQSIFCAIVTGHGQEKAPGLRYHPFAPLRLDEQVLFPREQFAPGQAANDFKALWGTNGFAGKVAELQATPQDRATRLECWLWLMQRYAWCVPVGEHTSLFDRNRIVAGLAACLTAFTDDAGQPTEQIEHWLKNVDRAAPPVALLVGGDLSGIQKFIYTITSQGAASALRGRSLYLQLLTDAIARYVLRRLELPITNLIQIGGGHFYLLARHTDGEQLRKIQCDISRSLLAFHGGDLYLALESVPLAADDFIGKSLSKRWSELSRDRLRVAKTRKFSELGDEMHAWVFAPGHDMGNEEKGCKVCGREHEETDNDTGKCPQCARLEDLGDELRHATYLRLDEVPFASIPDRNAPPGDWQATLRCFGMVAQLGNDDVPQSDREAARSVVFALRDDALDDLKPAAHRAIGRRFLVNVTPILTDEDRQEMLKSKRIPEKELPDVGSVKPFEVMEQQATSNFKRLGVLRMDVDDMGKIISEGLGDRATLARLAHVSFMLNLFFEGWAAEVARKYNRVGGAETDRVYSIYSGGDDLFFVGAWEVMPELALDIRNALFDFTARHPGVHASAGIALIGGKYPLYQAAEDSHAALQQAKDADGKNAITFLGQTMKWEKFADEVVPTTRKLRELMSKPHDAPRALLQKLAQFYRVYAKKEQEARRRGEDENQQGEPQVVWGPWNWHAAYYLSRLKVKDDATKDEIKKLRDRLSADRFRAIEWIGLAARWADLSTR